MGYLETLENELKGKNFFGGDEIGLVDIAGNFVALWVDVFLELVGIKLLTKKKVPRLCEWVDYYLNCGIIKESFPAGEDLLVHFHAISQWLAKNNI